MDVLDALPDHIALLDAEGTIVAVNAAWRRFADDNGGASGSQGERRTGVGANYLAQCDAAEEAPGAAGAAAGIRAVLAGRQHGFTLEYPCNAPEQPRWFQMVVSPLATEAAAAVVVHKDITDRKLEELRRRDSELRLQLALEGSGDGLWDWNLTTNEAHLSPGYYALTGYREGEIEPNFDFFRRLVHPGDFPGVMATMQSHLSGRLPRSEVVYRMLTASGEIRWVRGRGQVVERDAAGTPLRMAGHITDITRMKQVEQALYESEERYRAVLEAQTEVISRFRADGTFLFVNDAYCRLFRKTAAELLGRQWQPVVHPDDLATIESRLADLAPSSPVVAIENRVFTGDGTVRWMQFINHGFFDAAGQLTEIQSVGRDITLRKVLEEQQRLLLEENTRLGHELIRTQEVERSALARELHDTLSQQLAAIRAYAGAIERRAGEKENASRLDARAIGAAAGDIYAISHRLMEGLHPQSLDSIGLEAAIDGLARHWARTQPETVVRLRLTLAADSCNTEMRIHLFRIVQECLTNVFRHARARRVRIHVGGRHRFGRDWLRVVVRDDGIGFDVSQPKAGFGLISMRERARALDGRLVLGGQPGQGLRVEVEVPLDD